MRSKRDKWGFTQDFKAVDDVITLERYELQDGWVLMYANRYQDDCEIDIFNLEASKSTSVYSGTKEVEELRSVVDGKEPHDESWPRQLSERLRQIMVAPIGPLSMDKRPVLS